MWLQTVIFIVKYSKCAGLAQEIGFFAPNSCSLPWLVKGATQLCTSKKECSKLDLTSAEYIWLVDHNDWSRWFAISSFPHLIYKFTTCVSVMELSPSGRPGPARHSRPVSRPSWGAGPGPSQKADRARPSTTLWRSSAFKPTELGSTKTRFGWIC